MIRFHAADAADADQPKAGRHAKAVCLKEDLRIWDRCGKWYDHKEYVEQERFFTIELATANKKC